MNADDKTNEPQAANRDEIAAVTGVDLSARSSEQGKDVAPEKGKEPERRSMVQVQVLAMQKGIDAIAAMARTLAQRPECRDVASLLEIQATIADAASAQCDAFFVMAGVMGGMAQGATPAPPSIPPTFGATRKL